MTSTQFPIQRQSQPPAHIQRGRTVKPAPAATQAPGRTPAPDKGLDSAVAMLQLQSLVGNRAVQRMLTGRPVLPKLTVGADKDTYEREADDMAEQVTPSAEASSESGSPAVTFEAGQTASATVQRSGGDSAFQTDSGFESQLAGSHGQGSRLPDGTRTEMESKFGADFGGVRIHTGPQAVQLSQAINAEAFTHGQDIYMNKSRFAPQSMSSKRLLAHELTHVAQQTGGVQRKVGSVGLSGGLAANTISRKKIRRRLDFVKMKRKETHIVKMLLSKIKLAKKPDDAYGHWWTELGGYSRDGDWAPHESYGWWPSQGVGIKETFKGVAGALNGVGNFNGTATRDPHHGDQASEFNPAMDVDDSVDPKAFRQDTMNKIRTFATGFKGSWNWRLGWGKNCHTFQERMMKALGMKKDNGATKLDSGDIESLQAGDKAEESIAAWGKIQSTFEEYDGLQFVTMDTMLTQGRFTREDLFNALADTTPEERESRMKILIGHDTGVTQSDLDEFVKR